MNISQVQVYTEQVASLQFYFFHLTLNGSFKTFHIQIETFLLPVFFFNILTISKKSGQNGTKCD